jgi:DNA-binding MarR family transcriptional regulator/GNAT superfamily N-acetyltransferase
MPTATEKHIAAVRRFNRFYTRQIGVLRKGYLDSPYPLGEARVLYEISQNGGLTASDIARTLDLDAGYLSRLLKNFERRGLVARNSSAKDARQNHLTLTAHGQRAFAPLEKRSQAQVSGMLIKLKADEQAHLVAAMHSIQSLLDANPAPAAKPTLRQPRPGDYGWIISRHGALYTQEYGWDGTFEGLCAQIVADFVSKSDAKKERAWIAEFDGENIGCILLAKDSGDVARIRLLIVDPKARGHGLGRQLTDEAISFARAAGYKKITLWTHRNLTAARHIYKTAGFKLTRSEAKKSWGKDVVSEHWDLDL